MTTTYTKLRDGSWGLRSTESIAAGARIAVAKKSGETKIETVGRVVWTGNGITLATIQGSAATRRARAGYGRENCRRYGWDGVVGSPSYYSSGQYDEDS
jgi:hypothetical protein